MMDSPLCVAPLYAEDSVDAIDGEFIVMLKDEVGDDIGKVI